MKKLRVKKIFGPTIQGEGSESGTPAIFIRFSGCNMWDGNPETREKSSCPFCDTDFFHGDEMEVDEIVEKVKLLSREKNYLVVFSGGEPLLQPHLSLCALLERLHDLDFLLAVETNGSIHAPLLYHWFDFITCSPKVEWDKLRIDKNEVSTWKMLYPHPTLSIDPIVQYARETGYGLAKFYLQPIDAENRIQSASHAKSASTMVKHLGFPWRISIQVHKIIGEE